MRKTIRGSATIRRGSLLLIGAGCLGLLLSGCGPSGQDPNAKVTPAPKHAPLPTPVNNIPIDPDLVTAAKNQITASLNSNDPSNIPRVHALEALKDLNLSEHASDVMSALSSPIPLVRFAGVMTAGGMQLESAHQQLLALAEDPDVNVRVAVRYALHRLGDKSLSHDLEKFARDPRKEVRANTAWVLGLLNEPSAVRILDLMKNDPEATVRQQADESLWRMGETSGRDALIGFSVSQYPDDEIFAMLALAEPKDQSVGRTLETGLTQDYVEVNLAAARGLGELGYDQGYEIAARASKSPDQRQRFMAALALGAIGRPDSQPYLRSLLHDDYESVRIAAAEAVLELKSPWPGRASAGVAGQ